MKHTYFTLILTFVFFYSCNNSGKSDLASNKTNNFLIHSKALNEDREIYIKLPPNYDSQNREYPVVYVLDGEWNFEYVASYLNYMFDNNIFPEMIVTGVRNVNRNRDYVPRPDSYFDDTGEANTFLKFVKNEWVEEIERSFSTNGERIIIGHSFGGVFALHSLFSDPALFDAYLILGASAWIADNVLLDEANAYFANPTDSNAFVYMAVGEGDGGPTVPSNQSLVEIFEKKSPESLEWYFEITKKTDHFKNFSSGMHNGFMALFPAWGFADELTDAARKSGVLGVNEWFNVKHNTLGMRFQPSWFDLGVVALTLSQEGHSDVAITVIDELKSYYPQNGHIASFAATVFEMNGQYRKALNEYERAIKIVNEQKLHPNTLHLGNLERGATRMLEHLMN